MGTISSALSMMAQALNADQAALNVVSNNVANASTPGYTEESPTWRQNSPILINGALVGTGVTETGASSQRDRVLQERLNQQQELASASGARLTALNSVQALFTPASGSSSSTAGDIGSDLTGFFNSFSSLEANPTNSSLRIDVLSTASTLAGDISNAAASLKTQQSSLDNQVAGIVSQVNAITSNLAQINLQIQSISPTGDAGTLEDQRQQDLTELAQLIGVNQTTTDNNGLAISTSSGQLLVENGTSFQLTSGLVNGVTHLFIGTTDVTSQLASGGGAIAGDLTARDQDIPSVLASLDQLAYSISTQVNALNSSGSNPANATGTAAYIFSEPTQVTGSASAMSVVMTDQNAISSAALGQGTGDNSNAIAMYNLGSSAIVDGQTPTNFYQIFVTTLGSTVSGVETANTAQTASVTQLQTQRDALSSVNLNDEASSLMTLERAYQAASQVYAILNNLMASALNLGEQTTVS
jgi:flagellar hook-associated protein 1